METAAETSLFFSIFPILIMVFYIGIAAFAIYLVITVLKRMKERNEYLRDIRDELKKRNDHSI